MSTNLLNLSGWQDDYLPTVPHCWASIFDPYRINDILWEVPYWPCLENPTYPSLWISERFNPSRHNWAKDLLPIIKDWIFSQNPMFWRILNLRLSLNPGFFDFFSGESSLSFEVVGEGDLFISFLYQSKSFWSSSPRVGRKKDHPGFWENPFSGNWYFSTENGGLPEGYSVFNSDGILAPTRLKIYPEQSCDPNFCYSFSDYPLLRYFRRGYRKFKVKGSLRISFEETQFEAPLDGSEVKIFPLLGSFCVWGNAALVTQAKQALHWYLYENLNKIIEKIEDFCDFQEIKSALNSQGVEISEIGHLHKNGCSASFDYGNVFGFERLYWGIVFPVDQVLEIYAGSTGWRPYNPLEFEPNPSFLLISVVPNAADVLPSFALLRATEFEEIINWLDVFVQGEFLGAGRVIPGFDVRTRQGNYRYFLSFWTEYPNYQLNGLIAEYLTAPNPKLYLFQLMRNLSLAFSSLIPGEEGFFLRFSGSFQPDNLIPDPLWHWIFGPQIAGSALDPASESGLNCYVKVPFAGEEWLDLAAIADPDRTIIQRYLGSVGLIDKPRLFYPAINDLWSSGEDALGPDCRPYRIEWAKRGLTCWHLRHGELGRTMRLDQIALGGWVKYLQEVWGWSEGGVQWTSLGWHQVTPYPFSEEVIENWLYTVWSKEVELYEKAKNGEIPPFDWVTFQAAPWLGLQDYQKYRIGRGMPIDSPRLIELHHALNAREFSYLPGSTGDKPDRVWRLGNMIDLMAQVLGVCFNPDGTIRSIRQKSVVRNGEEIPAGWAFGQFGINEVTAHSAAGSGVNVNGPQLGGTCGELRPGIVYENRANRFDEDPYTGEPTKILPGDYVLCESFPQYLDQMLDDLDHALNLQELGALAIPAADGTEKKALIEGLGAIVAELLYMLSAISQQTAQTQVSSLKSQAMQYELLKAMGLPLVSQTFPVDLGFDGEPPYSVPFPGLAEDAPSLSQLFGAVLANLSLLQAAIFKMEGTTNEEIDQKAQDEGEQG